MAIARLALGFSTAIALVASGVAGATARDYRVSRGELRMPDGVVLQATYFLPVAATPDERFPVLLELLPYRKDDSFYLRDLGHHAAWARRGFVSVKVDVRGTGGSAGRAPEREYAAAELDDAVEIVRQLAGAPWSNGRVALWGISWGGFNAYQVALRRPPALAAIVVLHASDDLYRDGIDWLDGILHLDPYHLEIHHENGLPRTPAYALDAEYFRERFDVRPWLFEYLARRDDGTFWRPAIRLAQGARLEVPVYAIGGLLDGYRDFPFRLLEWSRAPVRADVGPWNHAWPHDGEPGPNYEWTAEAERFLRRFLVAGERAQGAERRLLLFVRSGHAPGGDLPTTPGRWLETTWPVPGSRRVRFHAGADGALAAAPPRAGARTLLAPAGSGSAAGLWWGETTGDQRADDGESLVYDSAPLERALVVAGAPRLEVGAAFDGSEGRVVARLEDVGPDGRVALVTGAARELAVAPETPTGLAFDLHATTWTFRPGHRVRLALTTAQFPMLWPTASRVALTVRSGGGDASSRTTLELPEIPAPSGPEPRLPPPAPRAERTDARWLECGEGPDELKRAVRDFATGATRYETATSCAWEIGARRYRMREENSWEVDDVAPGVARYLGHERHAIELEAGRRLELDTTIDLTSDATAFHLIFTRRISENGAQVRERTWRESYPRR